MRTLRFTYAAAVLSLFSGLVYLTGCERTETNPDAQATVARKTVTAQGGGLSTADGAVTVTLPAGAVATSTEIAVQRTDETAPKGIGRVYKLTPEGTTFAKPVTLTFKYTEADAAKTNPALMAVAYRKPDGGWQKVPTVGIDEKARTITVRTNHFSLWTLLEAEAGLSIQTEDVTLTDLPAELFFSMGVYMDKYGVVYYDSAMVVRTLPAANPSFSMQMAYRTRNLPNDSKYIYQFNRLSMSAQNRRYFYDARLGDADSTSVSLTEAVSGGYRTGGFSIPVYSYPVDDSTRVKYETLSGTFRLPD